MSLWTNNHHKSRPIIITIIHSCCYDTIACETYYCVTAVLKIYFTTKTHGFGGKFIVITADFGLLLYPTIEPSFVPKCKCPPYVHEYSKNGRTNFEPADVFVLKRTVSKLELNLIYWITERLSNIN
jgi:hypothetical protein